jgi:FkbM family methyltransferase
MRQQFKDAINGVLSRVGLRLIGAQVGPRGFESTFRRASAHGIRADQVIDVGAARGEWTRECMEIFPQAKYFLVDPLPENAEHLKAMEREKSNVSFWPGALGAQAGTLQMHVHGDQSSFLASEFGKEGTLKPVEVRTLDSILEEKRIAPPQIIKADVQGYELQVLEGAKRCLETTELLLVEVSFRKVYEQCPLAEDVIVYAKERGFRIYDICTYIQRPRDRELTQGDIVFARQDSRVFAHEGYW